MWSTCSHADWRNAKDDDMDGKECEGTAWIALSGYETLVTD